MDDSSTREAMAVAEAALAGLTDLLRELRPVIGDEAADRIRGDVLRDLRQNGAPVRVEEYFDPDLDLFSAGTGNV